MAVATAKPAWVDAILDDYRSAVAHTFIVYGNVADYADGERNVSVRDYLGNLLANRFTVVQYSPDEGITFAGPPSVATPARERFERVLGLGQQQAAPDPFYGAGGAAPAQGPVALPGAAAAALPLAVSFLREADGGEEQGDRTGMLAALLVERMDLVCPPADKGQLSDGKAALLSLLHRAGTDGALLDRQALTILLSPTLEEVHPDLRLASSGIRAIEVPLPDHGQRLAYVERVVARKGLACEMSFGELAAQTAGLGYRHIEDLALRAEANGGNLTRALVKARKGEMIASEYAEVLEIMEPDVTWDMVGGHALVKAYLQRRVIGPMRNPEQTRYVPMGIMFAGPSGTGKTWLARALARESGFNCVALSPDKIKGMWVGESERKLAKALRGVKALAPCILFIDEIDQKLRRVTGGGGGGGDSVEANTFGTMLEFLSDTGHRGEIVLVAATNRPDQIDAALKRPGRIDAKVPLLPPDSAEERAGALVSLLARHGLPALSGDTALDIGTRTDGWTPAELEGLVLEASSTAALDGVPLADAFSEALEFMRPATADVALHTRLAIEACDNARLVPERYHAQVGKAAAVAGPAPVQERKAGRDLEL